MSFSLLLISFFLELNVQFPFLSFSFVFVLTLFVFFAIFFCPGNGRVTQASPYISILQYLDIVYSTIIPRVRVG